MASEQVLIACIGVMSALGVIVLKDVIVRPLQERSNSRRAFTQMRLEKAYTPLEYLSFRLIQASDAHQQEQLIRAIGDIVQKQGHLLSDASLAALYTLCEDVDTGSRMLQQSFVPECAMLKRMYYALWYSSLQRESATHWTVTQHG